MGGKTVQIFDSVWDALEETPEAAAHMRLRSAVAVAVRAAVVGWGATQAEAARSLGVTQPRLNDLLRGRVERFSLEALIGLAERAGGLVRVEIERAVA